MPVLRSSTRKKFDKGTSVVELHCKQHKECKTLMISVGPWPLHHAEVFLSICLYGIYLFVYMILHRRYTLICVFILMAENQVTRTYI